MSKRQCHDNRKPQVIGVFVHPFVVSDSGYVTSIVCPDNVDLHFRPRLHEPCSVHIREMCMSQHGKLYGWDEV